VSGKPGNIRESVSCQGYVRGLTKSQGNVREPPPAPFYGPFSGTTRASGSQKKVFFWIFVVHRRITEADTPTIRMGATPSGLISDPSPTSQEMSVRKIWSYLEKCCC